jgi:MFS family permease
MTHSSVEQPGEWRLHGKVLLPCIAGVVLSATHGYALGVMIGPLEVEFGWSRARISSGMLVLAMTALVLAPLAGLAVDRFGPRRIALLGVPAYCTGIAALSLATPSVVVWWLLWFFLALANMLVLPTVWSTAISSYFYKNRGKALAFTLAGSGITAILVPVLASFFLGLYGWRGAYLALAGVMALLVFPLVLTMFHHAADRSPGRPAAKAGEAALASEGLPLAAVLRSTSFVKLAGGAALFSASAAALTFNAVPIVMAQGVSPVGAAGIAGGVGIGSIIGRLGGGILLDRYNARYVAGLGSLLPVCTIALLLGMEGSLAAYAVAFFLLGLASGIELDGSAYLASRHFGLRSFGTIFGTINGLVLFGSGLAPMIAGATYDATGSYDLFLWGSVLAFVAASALWLSLGNYPAAVTAGAEVASVPPG